MEDSTVPQPSACWKEAIPYDPKDPNAALGTALLSGEWAGEEISMIRRYDDGKNQYWFFWTSETCDPLSKNGQKLN